jgi:hypothetical protein
MPPVRPPKTEIAEADDLVASFAALQVALDDPTQLAGLLVSETPSRGQKFRLADWRAPLVLSREAFGFERRLCVWLAIGDAVACPGQRDDQIIAVQLAD